MKFDITGKKKDKIACSVLKIRLPKFPHGPTCKLKVQEKIKNKAYKLKIKHIEIKRMLK